MGCQKKSGRKERVFKDTHLAESTNLPGREGGGAVVGPTTHTVASKNGSVPKWKNLTKIILKRSAPLEGVRVRGGGSPPPLPTKESDGGRLPPSGFSFCLGEKRGMAKPLSDARTPTLYKICGLIHVRSGNPRTSLMNECCHF